MGRAPSGSVKRAASALDKLRPAESDEVLRALVEAHPELRNEAEEIARSLISDVSFEEIAEEVEWELASRDLDDLNARAGNTRWGYVDPTEAAWEILHEAIDPVIDEMQRHLALGLRREALETCKGLVLGLYGVRGKAGDSCLGSAPDFTRQTAQEILEKWSEGGGKKKSFPRSFMDQHVPEWRDLLDRVPSR